jgi:hypothetical protein
MWYLKPFSPFSNLEMIINALKIHAYGLIVNVSDDYCKLENLTTMQSFKRFVIVVQVMFEVDYLYKPILQDQFSKFVRMSRSWNPDQFY